MQKENYQQKHGSNYPTTDPCYERGEDKGEGIQGNKAMKNIRMKTMKITITMTETIMKTTKNKKGIEKIERMKKVKIMKKRINKKEDKKTKGKTDNR